MTNILIIHKNYVDVTQQWLKSINIKTQNVIDSKYFKYNNEIYKVDGKNIVLEYSQKEKKIALWIVNKFGGKIYMIPRVNKPKNIKTADYLWNDEYWDLKSISAQAISKNRAVDNIIKTAKGQSCNFILDITNTKIARQLIIKQVKRIYDTRGREWVDKIIIIDNYQLIKIYTRKKKPSPLQSGVGKASSLNYYMLFLL